MTDNEKMMLPLKILSDLSINAGTIDIEELMKDESEEDKEYIKGIIDDLIVEGYIAMDNEIIYLKKKRFYANWSMKY